MEIIYAENLPILPIIGEVIRIGPNGANWVKIEVE